jgi:anti-sigma factor RsiW
MRPLMTCRELIEFLDGYVEETLSAEQRREFDRHLALCPPCVAYLESYRDTTVLSRLTAEPDRQLPETVPEDLIAAILAARRC